MPCKLWHNGSIGQSLVSRWTESCIVIAGVFDDTLWSWETFQSTYECMSCPKLSVKVLNHAHDFPIQIILNQSWLIVLAQLKGRDSWWAKRRYTIIEWQIQLADSVTICNIITSGVLHEDLSLHKYCQACKSGPKNTPEHMHSQMLCFYQSVLCQDKMSTSRTSFSIRTNTSRESDFTVNLSIVLNNQHQYVDMRTYDADPHPHIFADTYRRRW